MQRPQTRRMFFKRAGLSGLAIAACGVHSAVPAAAVNMKITSLRAWQPATPGSPPDWRTQLGQIVVEVQTDAGLTGIGVGGGGAASIHVIHTVMRDLLLGKDAAQVEELHRAMHQHTLFYGRKGLVVMATSGIDLALWDLRGKAAGLPVAKLLNPQVNLATEIPTYGTVFSEKEIDAALAIGHDSLKVHTESYGRQPNVNKLVGFVQSVRDRLGPKKSLMLDAFCMWDIDTTVQTYVPGVWFVIETLGSCALVAEPTEVAPFTQLMVDNVPPAPSSCELTVTEISVSGVSLNVRPVVTPVSPEQSWLTLTLTVCVVVSSIEYPVGAADSLTV